MKIMVGKVRENEPAGLVLAEGVLHFIAAKPTVIQPSEIMKVPINAVVRIPGGVLLNISTSEELASKAGELFPALIALDNMSGDVVLELPIRNSGRNQINLQIGDVVARGHLVPIEFPTIEEFTIQIPNADRPKTRPQKKNDGIKFEVK